MKRLTFLLILCIIVVLAFSCAKKPPPGELTEEEPIVIEEEGVITEEVAETTAVVEDTTVVEPPPPPEPTTVYRIQIGAFYGVSGANKRKARAVSYFDKPVYVEYIAPYYKVRIGDFATKAEALNYKSYTTQYFTDAFVVETSKTP